MKAGGTASATLGNVSVEADAARMVDEVLRRYGRLDILVNNAGAPQGADRNEIEDVPVAAWDLTMGVNARGCFLMSRAAVPAMRRAGWGRIVSVSSRAAFRPGAKRTAYAASKAAIVGFTKSLAFDLAPCGITVNAVLPGPIRTSRAISTNRREFGDDLEMGFRERAKAIPVGRFGSSGRGGVDDRVSRVRCRCVRHRAGDRRRRRLVRPMPALHPVAWNRYTIPGICVLPVTVRSGRIGSSGTRQHGGLSAPATAIRRERDPCHQPYRGAASAVAPGIGPNRADHGGGGRRRREARQSHHRLMMLLHEIMSRRLSRQRGCLALCYPK